MKKQILFLLIFLTKANASLAQTQKMDCALTLGSREIAFTAGIPLLSPTVKLTLDFAVSRQIRIELNHIHPKSLIPTHIKNITLYTDTNSILLNKRNLNCSD